MTKVYSNPLYFDSCARVANPLYTLIKLLIIYRLFKIDHFIYGSKTNLEMNDWFCLAISIKFKGISDLTIPTQTRAVERY